MITSRAMPAPLPGSHRRVANHQGHVHSGLCRPPGTGPLVDRGNPSRSSRPPGVPLRTESATTTITRAVTVAAGVFAPGHLGELTGEEPTGAHT